jgi:Ca2+-binding RTX toxin-like protein
MTSFIHINTSSGTQTLAGQEWGYVDVNSSIVSAIAGVMIADGSSPVLSVFGVIANVANTFGGGGVRDDGDSASSTLILVGSTGSISARTNAIDIGGAFLSLINHGIISAHSDAITFRKSASLTSATAVIENTGHILSRTTALSIGAVGEVNNSGTIEGSIAIVGKFFSIVVRNTGTILGATAILGSIEADAVVSTGEIVGNVWLNEGADTARISGTLIGSIFGGSGDDTISLLAARGDNEVFGGAGNDTFVTDGTGGDFLEILNQGDDHVISRATAYTLGDNVERLTLRASALDGHGNALNNTITGNARGNILSGEAGNDTINGFSGRDQIAGDGGNDSLFGDAGADTLQGGTGNDRLDGGDGDDALWGENDADTLFGGLGDDVLRGGKGGDALTGGEGDDSILGGTGNDVLNGGEGGDTMNGGLGADTFYFAALTDSSNVEGFDLIQGFVSGQDKLHLSAIDANGALAGDPAFVFMGTAAFTAAGQVRYSVSGSDVVVEVNVVGTSGAEMTIRLSGLGALVAGDFFL